MDHTVQKCQDAIHGELVLIRKRFIDVANGLLNDKPDLPSIRAASQLIHDHFPPIARAAACWHCAASARQTSPPDK